MSGQSPAEASLDDRKFAFERDARFKEIAIRDRELSIKETELRRSRWLNPTVIGLVAAAIGLFGNLLVTFFANVNNQRIEKFKAQSNLIVQAVGTGDAKSACRNLISFIRLGLLEDLEGRLSKCETDLNTIPVLPSSSAYYTPSLDTPAAASMAPVVSASSQGDHYHYDVSFTVPTLTGLAGAANPPNLVTIYSYKLDGAGTLSEGEIYNPLHGNWKSGDRINFGIDIPRFYIDDTNRRTYLRFCVGSVQACVPGPNILLPETPMLPAANPK
jgi:hypothetical protein